MGIGKMLFTRIMPAPLLRPVMEWRSRRQAGKYAKLAPAEAFTDIFKTNYWKSSESSSGVGSEEGTTRNISKALPRLIQKLSIKTMFDAPCGDFHWMRNVDLAGIDYTGGDIVAPIIEAASAKYAGPNRKFVRFDLVAEIPPAVDLIFCRDCFIHLPFAMIQTALANFRKSGSKFLLTTTYRDWPLNYDTAVGGIRAVDLCKWPFNLPRPLELIDEGPVNQPGDPVHCMGLWSIDSLPH